MQEEAGATLFTTNQLCSMREQIKSTRLKDSAADCLFVSVCLAVSGIQSQFIESEKTHDMIRSAYLTMNLFPMYLN